MQQVIQEGQAQSPVSQGLDDVVALFDRVDVNADGGAAVFRGYDNILRDVDEAAGEIPGVGGFQRRVGQPFAGAVGRYEVLQNREALFEVRPDGYLDDLPARLCHETPHTGQLADLLLASPRAGLGHAINGVDPLRVAGQLIEHLLGDNFIGVGPEVYDAVVALLVGNVTVAVLVFYLL